MRQNVYNVLIFLILTGGLIALWLYAQEHWLKDEAPKPAEKVEKKDDGKKKAEPKDKKKEQIKEKEKEAEKPAPKPPEKLAPYVPPTLIQLGGDGFYLKPMLTTQGGSVQQMVLTEFQEADRLGRGVKNGADPAPLYLIPGTEQIHGALLEDNPPLPDLTPGPALDPNLRTTPPEKRLIDPSYAIFHYPTPDDNYPDPLLGTTNWKVVDQQLDGDVHTVVFETELAEPFFLKIRRTYTLAKHDYHVGMKLEFRRLKGGEKGKGITRFQISGPRRLPVEGEWYTSLTRVALIGWENSKGAFKRQFEDAATITIQRGGEKAVSAGGENRFKYAGIATQSFTSALAIDDPAGKTNWTYVRSTSELGMIPPPDEIKKLEDQVKKEPGDAILAARLARIRNLRDRHLPEMDDITFRAVTEPIDLGPDETLAQSYAIYNGPTKVRLLKLLEGDKKVDDALVDKYHDDFGLRTLTDYRSPTAIGRFAEAIYWTDLVILFTNLMHLLLWAIHYVLGSWGVSIIILTVMVRLLLFIPSRKQTQMNLKMMEVQKKLKPELDKLHEKYKDDFQTYNREKTRLMLQHGMNPFSAMGGCLLLFAQMPIMMGLYYCLQESIFFRLEPFLWIDNLAAPDMTVWWTEKVPLISDPDNRHGTFSFLYLGPYFNILPLIAVSLMLYQQHKMMPPPTDEQQATQQRMMKIMMIVVAFMFYKVAAGLALYFIISTTWGLIERQLIPKPKVKLSDDGGPALPPRGAASGPAETTRPRGLVGRLRQRIQAKLEELQKKAAEQSARQVKNPNRPEPFRKPDRKKKRK
ncbi:MAG TPA: membrane protein insertase YidC [Urbifossiella sp.]|nr:membrane protein insertase YidC [Urbifossiella sp.]